MVPILRWEERLKDQTGRPSRVMHHTFRNVLLGKASLFELLNKQLILLRSAPCTRQHGKRNFVGNASVIKCVNDGVLHKYYSFLGLLSFPSLDYIHIIPYYHQFVNTFSLFSFFHLDVRRLNSRKEKDGIMPSKSYPFGDCRIALCVHCKASRPRSRS